MLIKMSNEVYDVLKHIAQIYLPAAGTLYFALAGIWGWPAADEVVKTVVAVDTFLGVVLGLSSAQYNAPEPQHKAETPDQDLPGV